uniref:DNA-directed DNA polymerase n=1 Tax=Ditylenchus dipsaci TaxID=166011 RepID=A0A915DPC1_9BILA
MQDTTEPSSIWSRTHGDGTRLFDIEYPGMYRVVAFDTNPQLRPFFKGPNGRRFEVPVYLDNGHFDGLKRINTFFRVRNYCVDCEGPYDRDVKAQAKLCFPLYCLYWMGPDYPCQPEPGVFLICKECNRSFRNMHCYTNHQQNGRCDLFKVCALYRMVNTDALKQDVGHAMSTMTEIVHVPYSLSYVQKSARSADGSIEHEINMISARVTCTRCVGDHKQGCDICGNEEHKMWSAADDDRPIRQPLCVNRLYQVGIRPEVTMTGARSSKPLQETGKDTAESILKAKESSHFFNTPENYNVHLDHLPEKHYYGYETMTVAAKEKFDACHSARSLPEDERDLLNITDGYDVLQDACTIAGVCMKLYKESSLEKDHLYIVPEKGYERNDRQSAIAIKWMEWVSEQRGINIQHAGNGGEFKIKTTMGRCFKLDGYDLDNLKAYEFNGCHYHGCPKCYKRGDKQQANFKSAEENLAITEKRLADLRTSIEVETIWECELHAMLKADPDMAKWFKNHEEKGPINPHDGFFGGRTGPSALMAKAGNGTKISMADIVSLYPMSCTQQSTLLGHLTSSTPKNRKSYGQNQKTLLHTKASSKSGFYRQKPQTSCTSKKNRRRSIVQLVWEVCRKLPQPQQEVRSQMYSHRRAAQIHSYNNTY